MEKLYFGSNLKMYKNIEQTEDYLKELVKLTADISRNEIELFVIPSYTSLDRVGKSIDQNYIKLGAQNMCWEEQGQFTGEISPLMLQESAIQLVMIGHSERRHVFHETDEDESKKVRCGLKHGFTILLCVGETVDDKKYDLGSEVLRTQLKIDLYGVSKRNLKHVWVAYEPVWSIGVNGIPAKADYAERMQGEIKKCLLELFGEEGRQIPVLYGGSVNTDNAEELIMKPSIDGLFVGRAAWKADKFNDLIRMVKKKYDSRK